MLRERERTIVDFLRENAIGSHEDLDRETARLEEITERIEEGEEALIPLADYLAKNIEAYEDEILDKMDIPVGDGVDLVQMLMSQHDLTVTSLAKSLGMQRTVLSEILNRRNRKFTLEQIKSLGRYFRIDPGLFL